MTELKIADYRELFGYSQREMASMFDVFIGDYLAWEYNEAAPDLRILREMALHFGCSVLDLLGDNPLRDDEDGIITCHDVGRLDESVDEFIGYVGIEFANYSEPYWFPVSRSDFFLLQAKLDKKMEGTGWYGISTLNNRFLFINQAEISKIEFVRKDNRDSILIGEFPFFGKTPYAQEYNTGLEWLFFEQDNWFGMTTKKYRDEIERFADQHNLNRKEIKEILCETVIYKADGKTEKFDLNRETLLSIDEILSEGEDCISERIPALMKFQDKERFNVLFLPTTKISMVATPMLQVLDEVLKD